MRAEEFFTFAEDGKTVVFLPIVHTFEIVQAFQAECHKHELQQWIAYTYYYTKRDFLPSLIQRHREKRIKTMLGFAENRDVPVIVLSTIDFLDEAVDTIQTRTFKVLKKNLARFIDLLENIGDRNEERLQELEGIFADAFDEESETKRKTLIKELQEDLKTTLTSTTNVAKTIKEVDEYEKQSKKEVGTDERVFGSRTPVKWDR